MSIGSNVKSRVVNWILAAANRDLDKLLQQTNALKSEILALQGSQPSLKTEDYANAVQMQTVIIAHKAKLEEMRSRSYSNRRSLTYRILFAWIIILVLRPFASNRKSMATFADDGAIGRTNQFLLDLCLPPDRAEDASTALQDTCESKWEKRYSPRKVALLCFVQTISAIYAYHAGRIFKNGGLFWVIAELKRALPSFGELDAGITITKRYGEASDSGALD
jgi:hypothetical protein